MVIEQQGIRIRELFFRDDSPVVSVEDVAQLLVAASRHAWRFIDACHAAGFSPREETITEHLLVALHHHSSEHVRIHKHSAFREHTSGADMAVAIETPRRDWLHLLFQAKKLSNKGNYRELTVGPPAFDQARHLISEAAATGAAPLYLFYNGSHLTDNGVVPAGDCTFGSLVRAPHGPPWVDPLGRSPAGCTVASAGGVLEVLQGERRRCQPAVFAKLVSPWECLICPFSGGLGRPSALPWPDTVKDDLLLPAATEHTWLRPDPPDWAGLLIRDENPERDPSAPAVGHFVVLLHPQANPRSGTRRTERAGRSPVLGSPQRLTAVEPCRSQQRTRRRTGAGR